MKEKHEEVFGGLFYCFVDLGPSPEAPIKCYVIPSDVVAPVISRSHEIWRSGLGVRGQKRQQDGIFRRLLPSYNTASMDRPGITDSDRAWLGEHGEGCLNKYSGAWHLLAL
jgi:hypothetical protein